MRSLRWGAGWFLVFVMGIALCRGSAAEEKNIGLSVEPGGLLIQNVPVGQLYDMDYWIKMRFKIYNDSEMARTYTLSVDKAFKVGAPTIKGYSDIPDPAWFWFEKSEVQVGADSFAEVKMYLRVPNEDKYANQKWAVGIDVEARPEKQEKLVLSLSPVFYIETESKADVKEKPAGFIGLVPGVVEASPAPGKKEARKFRLVNNDDQPRLFKLSVRTPAADSGRQVITPSSGFSWIQKREWLKLDRESVKLGPHEEKELSVSVDIPKDHQWENQRWEAIIFVESDQGLSNFTRVQLQTAGGG